MDLGVLEGQTRGDYFLNSIFDPSVKQCSGQGRGHLGLQGNRALQEAPWGGGAGGSMVVGLVATWGSMVVGLVGTWGQGSTK